MRNYHSYVSLSQGAPRGLRRRPSDTHPALPGPNTPISIPDVKTPSALILQCSYLRHSEAGKVAAAFPRQLILGPTTPVALPSATEWSQSQEGRRAAVARAPGSISKPHSDKVCGEPVLYHILSGPLLSSQTHWHLLGTGTRWPGRDQIPTPNSSPWKPHSPRAICLVQPCQGRDPGSMSGEKEYQKEENDLCQCPPQVYSRGHRSR